MSDFTEVLIGNVKKHRILYDLSHADYKNVRTKNKVWDEIAKDVGSKHTGDDLKKRWKNLRDCFSNYLRAEKTRTGQAAKPVCRYKTWPWAQHMETFRPFLQFAQTDSNVLDDDRTETAEETEVSIERNEATDPALNPLNEEHYESQEGPSEKTTHIRDCKREKKRKSADEQTSNSSAVDRVIDFLDKRHNDLSNHCDAIDLIFQGYAASVRKLPLQSQAAIKYKIAKMIMKEEVAQIKAAEKQSRPGTSFTSISTSSYETSNMAAPQHESFDGSTSSVPYAIRGVTDGGSIRRATDIGSLKNCHQLQQLETDDSSLDLEHYNQSETGATLYGDLCHNSM